MKNKRFKYMLIFWFIVIAQVNIFGQIHDSLDYYLEIAAKNNPEVKAAFLLYQASLQKIPQAGEYQDPQLDMGFFLQPMELVEGRQVAQFKLMQMFPWFGTREAARTEAQHMSKMVYEQFREIRNQLWLNVYSQWFRLLHLQQQLNNNLENKQLLIQLDELALRKFTSPINNSNSGKVTSAPLVITNAQSTVGKGGASGMASMGTTLQMQSNMSSGMQGSIQNMSNKPYGMPDVLRIKLEILETDNNIESTLSEIQAEKSKFNVLLNRQIKSEIQIPDSIVQISFLLEEDYIKEQIKQKNPMLIMLIEEELAYKAKLEMDKKMSYPMFGIGLQYMLINKSNSLPNSMNMSGMNGKDMVMPMVSISIPIFRNKYQSQQREDLYMQQASHQKYINMLNLLESEMYSTINNLNNAANKIDMYRRQLELVRATYKLTVQEFASGKGDLTNIIQVQRQLLDYKLKISESIVIYNTMAATIQKLVSSNKE